ncbi:MAG TPA: hypothetical protein VLG92_01815 [Candidatus Saccharimonadia bacterium]|nr:hypothetical protein [Candidatus Saccharimonadia bacterium]
MSRKLGPILACGLVVVIALAGALGGLRVQPNQVATAMDSRSAQSSVLPINPSKDLACELVPLATARQVVDGNLKQATPDVPDGDYAYQCLYVDTTATQSVTSVQVDVYREAISTLRSGMRSTSDSYIQKRPSPYYDKALVEELTIQGFAAAYHIHSPKYGHDLLFLNNGTYTIRIRVTKPGMSGYSFDQQLASRMPTDIAQRLR